MRPPYRRYVADLLTLANGVFGFLAILVLSVEWGAFRGVSDAHIATMPAPM